MASARRIGKKWRVVEPGTMRLVRNKAGTAVDGGGHDTRLEAEMQAAAIRRSLRKKKSK